MVGFVITLVGLIAGVLVALAYFPVQKQWKAEEARVKEANSESRFTAARNDYIHGKVFAIVGSVLIVISLGFMIPQTFYTQDIGESKVQVSWTGELVGQTTTPGVHFKAPWVSALTFDVRNNLVAYVGSGDTNYSGNATTGPQITFQDAEGVTGNMDLTVRYSIQPDAVLDLYSEYQTQEAFVSKVISETVRSEARKATSSRTTIQVYSERADLNTEILLALEEKLSPLGVNIEDVAVQELRYSEDVVARFDDAQAARIAVDKAEAEQAAALVQAETRVIEAQGQADANAILEQSLSPEILTQKYIDALRESGQVYIVPEGSTPFITVP